MFFLCEEKAKKLFDEYLIFILPYSNSSCKFVKLVAVHFGMQNWNKNVEIMTKL